MATGDPNNSPVNSIDSESRKRGRRLVLEFVGDESPELDAVEFKYDRNSEPIRLEQNSSTEGCAFTWTAVPKGLSLLILSYVYWKKGGNSRTFVFPKPGEDRFAVSLGDDRYKDKGLLKRLFTEKRKDHGDIAHVRWALKVDFPHKKNRPNIIRINERFLPADCVEILWSSREGLVDQQAILELANRLRESLGLKPEKSISNPPAPLPKTTPGREQKYALAIRNKYGHVPLDILDVKGGLYRNFSFSHFYVPPSVCECQEYRPRIIEASKVQLEGFERDGGAGTEEFEYQSAVQDRYRQQVRQNVTDVVDDEENPRIVVLGSLGAGKSSLLRFLVLQWAETARSKRSQFNLPLLIELQLYAEARNKPDEIQDFVDFLDRGAGAFWRFPKAELETRLTSGGATAYFDGLDEILDPKLREEVVTSIVRFADEYPAVRIVVTSRHIGYGGEALRHAGFKHFMLQDFDQDEIDFFIENWHQETARALKTSRADKKSHRLKQAIAESQSLRELAGSPFLLTMLLILNDQGTLPKSRVELLERCAVMLLEHWKVNAALRADPDLAQEATALGIREKRMVLRRLAREMSAGTREFPDQPQLSTDTDIDDGETDATLAQLPPLPYDDSPLFSNKVANSISTADLEDSIRKSVAPLVRSNPIAVARAMIRQFRERNGVLCINSEDRYSFVHRSFLEFFCADDIKEQFIRGAINERALRLRYFETRWNEESWHEILCLLCGMFEPEFVLRLLKRLVNWRDVKGSEELLLFIAECLKEIKNLEQSGPFLSRVKKELMAVSLRQHQESTPFPPFPPDTPSGLREDIKDYMRDDWQAQDEQTERNAVRSVELLAKLFPGDSEVLGHLRNFIDGSEHHRVWEAAIKALAQGWQEHPELRDWLVNYANQSSFDYVRRAAVATLVNRWAEHPITLACLKSRLTLDSDCEVRERSVFEITKRWTNNAAIFRWLEGQVARSEYGDVRTSIVEGIADNHESDRFVLTWLKKIVRSNNHEEVRAMAVNKIDERCGGEPRMFHFFNSIARADRSPEVRRAALIALCDNWEDHPTVRSLIKMLVRHDKDGGMRAESLQRLAQVGKGDKRTFALLKSVAQSDSDSEARSVAITALFEDWKDEPQTLQILKTCLSDKSFGVSSEAYRFLRDGWNDDPEVQAALENNNSISLAGIVTPAPISATSRPGESTRGAGRRNNEKS